MGRSRVKSRVRSRVGSHDHRSRDHDVTERVIDLLLLAHDPPIAQAKKQPTEIQCNAKVMGPTIT